MGAGAGDRQTGRARRRGVDWISGVVVCAAPRSIAGGRLSPASSVWHQHVQRLAIAILDAGPFYCFFMSVNLDHGLFTWEDPKALRDAARP